MPTDRARRVNLVEMARNLAAITEGARDCAVSRDFAGLAQAIDRRDEVIKAMREEGDLITLPANERAAVLKALARTQELDSDIRKVLESEMASESQAMADTNVKSKALSAYERIVPRPSRFDTQK